MIEIKNVKAFVGHSFNEMDKQLIDKFLEYFNSLKSILEWNHAKETEPKGLSTKVKDVMKDKDVFIGIFTRKHQVGLFVKKWLPSLWVVQESGYAVGKEMKLIFLVEDGIDKDDLDGLHADYELIFFSRKHPEKSFDKINHMILEIFKSVANIETYSAGIRLEDNNQDEGKRKEKTEPLDLQLLDAIKADKEDEVDRIFAKILEESGSENEKCRNECWKLFMYHMQKKWDVIDALDDLANKYPKCYYPHEYKGDVLKDLKDYKGAIVYYCKAKDICSDFKDKLRIELEISKTKRASFDYDGLEDKLNELSGQCPDDVSRASVYEEQGYLYLERDKSKEKAITSFEKVLEIDPDNMSIRFILGYQCAELGNNEKSLFYYRTYCDNKDNPSVFNNLGVAYDRLGMPIKAVQCFERSADKKYTLGMANLANQYIDKGFIEHAQKILDEALRCDAPHANVAKAFSRIQTLKDEEDKKEKEIIDGIIKAKVVKVDKSEG
jgi:tetratricopeptide (TPR) repeat protein